ncbi:hypothetical protein [Haloglomus litoreum]|uniref:hypothetical protein n=1 Tax=Haloglomus litoreum TaxID=3034026 RepID=UPI0023E89157|nr:hypothetical protein [Haloglomus sp. DT116]
MRRRRFLLGVGTLVGLAGCGSDASEPTVIDGRRPDIETESPPATTFDYRPDEPPTGTLYEGTVDGQEYVRGPFFPGQPVTVETQSVPGSLVAELVAKAPVARRHVYQPRTARLVARERGAAYLALRADGGPAELAVRAGDEQVRPERTGVVFDREIERTRSVAAGPGISAVEVSVTGLDDGEKLVVGYPGGRRRSRDDGRIQFYEDATRTFDLATGTGGGTSRSHLFRLSPLRTAEPFDRPVAVDVTVTARTPS